MNETIKALHDGLDNEKPAEKLLKDLLCRAADIGLNDENMLKLIKAYIAGIEKCGPDKSADIMNQEMDAWEKRNKESKASIVGDFISNSLNDSLNNNPVKAPEMDSKKRLQNIISSLINKVSKCAAYIKGDRDDQPTEIGYNDDIVQKEIETMTQLRNTLAEKTFNMHESHASVKENFDLELRLR